MTTNTEVRAITERIARIDEEIAERQSDRKDVLAEAKSKGYDQTLISKVAKIIGMEADKRKKTLDQLSLFDSYLDQAGLK